MVRRTSLLLALVVAVVVPSAARAQYVFLDTNGNGAHDEGDALAASGSTTVDVWFVTDTNGDGTPAACPDGVSPLDFFSAEVRLDVFGGTVSWSGYVNRTPWGVLAASSTSTQFYRFTGGMPTLPPGTYLVATVVVTVLTGAPSIAFAPGTAAGTGTSFGSACPGMDFDDTMKLGSDFLSSDGVSVPSAIDTSPPTPVDIMGPARGATFVSLTTSFDALTASDATPPVEYAMELYADASCAGSPVAVRDWDTSTHWPTPLRLRESTAYGWRVRARDSVSPTPNVSAWSACATFTTEPDLDAPLGVANLSPPDWGMAPTTSAVLVAADATDATLPVLYEFELYELGTTGPCSGTLVDSRAVLPDSSYTLVATLVDGMRYAWHVRATDSAVAHNRSAWSACTVFTAVDGFDAGMPDAGPPDAGVADAGDVDAGDVDAGAATDAGADAGATADASAPDGGVATDAGAAMDADVDAGAADAGDVDAGAATDGGATDAGADAGTVTGADGGGHDAGGGSHDAGPFADAAVDLGGTTVGGGGCTCAAAGTPAGGAALPVALSVLALVALRARRRRGPA